MLICVHSLISNTMGRATYFTYHWDRTLAPSLMVRASTESNRDLATQIDTVKGIRPRPHSSELATKVKCWSQSELSEAFWGKCCCTPLAHKCRLLTSVT